MIALFSDFSFDGHYSFRISRWPVSVTSSVTDLSNSSSISSSRSGDDNSLEPVPTSNTFGGFMTFSKTRYLDSLPLLNVAYTNITSPTLFFINSRVWVRAICVSFSRFRAVFIVFNLNFYTCFRFSYTADLILIRPFKVPFGIFTPHLKLNK